MSGRRIFGLIISTIGDIICIVTVITIISDMTYTYHNYRPPLNKHESSVVTWLVVSIIISLIGLIMLLVKDKEKNSTPVYSFNQGSITASANQSVSNPVEKKQTLEKEQVPEKEQTEEKETTSEKKKLRIGETSGDNISNPADRSARKNTTRKVFCPFCGEQINERMIFCGYCGEQIPEGIFAKKEVADDKGEKQLSFEGAYYIGETIDLQANGQGKIHYQDGITYEGGWAFGLKNGNGTTVYPDGRRTESIWDKGVEKTRKDFDHDGNLVYDGQCGYSSAGEYEPNGTGTFYREGKKVYEGEHNFGIYSGNGIYTFRDGSTFTGCWLNGKPLKEGKYDSVEGYTVSGSWSTKGLQEGKVQFVNGISYEGSFNEAGLFHGTGLLQNADGEELYNGKWKDGEPDPSMEDVRLEVVDLFKQVNGNGSVKLRKKDIEVKKMELEEKRKQLKKLADLYNCGLKEDIAVMKKFNAAFKIEV